MSLAGLRRSVNQASNSSRGGRPARPHRALRMSLPSLAPQWAMAASAAPMPAHLCSRYTWSMPPSGPSSRGRRSASTMVKLIRPMLHRPLRVMACWRSCHQPLATPCASTSGHRPRSAGATASQAAVRAASQVARTRGIRMGNILSCRAVGVVDAGAGLRRGLVVRAVAYLFNGTAARVHVQLHRLALGVQRLHFIAAMVKVDLAHLAVACGVHAVVNVAN